MFEYNPLFFVFISIVEDPPTSTGTIVCSKTPDIFPFSFYDMRDNNELYLHLFEFLFYIAKFVNKLCATIPISFESNLETS